MYVLLKDYIFEGFQLEKYLYNNEIDKLVLLITSWVAIGSKK